jgi:hypothetical protein
MRLILGRGWGKIGGDLGPQSRAKLTLGQGIGGEKMANKELKELYLQVLNAQAGSTEQHKLLTVLEEAGGALGVEDPELNKAMSAAVSTYIEEHSAQGSSRQG